MLLSKNAIGYSVAAFPAVTWGLRAPLNDSTIWEGLGVIRESPEFDHQLRKEDKRRIVCGSQMQG